MKILLIRHAESEINLKGITHKTGDDAKLTLTGRKQAEALIGIFRNYSIERIYSSPEARAFETADIVGTVINKPIEVIVGLQERNWGVWGGRNWEEIEKDLRKMTTEERYEFNPPGGESWKEMDERLKKVIEQITNNNKKNMAIITHEGTLRALVTLLTKAPKESSFNLHFDNASVTTFDYTNSKFTKQTINDISHLESFA